MGMGPLEVGIAPVSAKTRASNWLTSDLSSFIILQDSGAGDRSIDKVPEGVLTFDRLVEVGRLELQSRGPNQQGRHLSATTPSFDRSRCSKPGPNLL